MEDGLASLAGLHGRIADVRRQFFAERERLEQSLGRAFDDPASASDVLLSLAEEYGPEGAVELLRERPFDVGELLPNPDITEELEGQLSDIMQTQDWLDDLTTEREKLSRSHLTSQVINIQGDEYLVDKSLKCRELQSVNEPILTHDLIKDLQPAQTRPQEPEKGRTR